MAGTVAGATDVGAAEGVAAGDRVVAVGAVGAEVGFALMASTVDSSKRARWSRSPWRAT